ncbi:lysophospholipid acyltransferase family protein [bacterium]|nr:lysophospholipid acyltransferase family protein [bacterium]
MPAGEHKQDACAAINVMGYEGMRKHIEYYFLKILETVFSLFSFGISRKIGACIGIVAYLVDRSHRQVARENLCAVFKDKKLQEIDKIIKRVYVNLGQSLAEFFYIPWVDRRFVDRFVEIKGKEYMDAALAQGKGVINVVGHFGNWELINPVYRVFGYPLTAVAYPQNNELTNEVINQYRISSGAVIVTNEEPYKNLVKILSQGGLLILVADQDAGSHGIFVDFLGKQASTAKGPAILALRTSAPIIITCLIRKGSGYQMIMSKPLELIKTDNWKEDVFINTRLWCKGLEEYIYQYPDQWFWLHRRWKTRVGG